MTRLVSKNAAAALVSVGILGGVGVACGSSGGSTFDNGAGQDASADGRGGPQFGGTFEGGILTDAFDPDAYYFNDPPPRWCGPEAGATAPPAPGGTPECPDDKNRQGCTCAKEGDTASCWPGPRASRNLGICKDGVTTCTRVNELTTVWGPCVNAVLPKSGATKGRDACQCFSQGNWKLTNVVPCYIRRTQGGQEVDQHVESSYVTGVDDAGVAQWSCRSQENGSQRTDRFTDDTLSVDCEGRFNLCFQIKVGDFRSPQATDCAVMDPICTGVFEYPVKGQVTQLPDLPAWQSTTAEQKACARQFRDRAGYAELSVKGESYLCEQIDDGTGNREVFQRFPYCPLKCAETPTAPECVGCTNGANGQF